MCLTAEEKNIKARWCKAHDDAEAVPEEELDGIVKDSVHNKARRTFFMKHYEENQGRINIIQMATDASLETTAKEVNNRFSPKVILVNHEKKLGVDTVASNLAIKFNMIYLSAYQCIRKHITENTEWGKKLQAGQKTK